MHICLFIFVLTVWVPIKCSRIHSPPFGTRCKKRSRRRGHPNPHFPRLIRSSRHTFWRNPNLETKTKTKRSFHFHKESTYHKKADKKEMNRKNGVFFFLWSCLNQQIIKLSTKNRGKKNEIHLLGRSLCWKWIRNQRGTLEKSKNLKKKLSLFLLTVWLLRKSQRNFENEEEKGERCLKLQRLLGKYFVVQGAVGHAEIQTLLHYDWLYCNNVIILQWSL